MNVRWVIGMSSAAAIVAVAGAAFAVPLGTAVTYQGRLKNAGQPANGTFNLVFTLWDAAGAGNPPVGGVQIGAADNEPTTTVTDGLFTVQLNDTNQFGATAFNGDARWVQIAVNGTTLGPRQPLTAAPYAHGVRLPLAETTQSTSPAMDIRNTGNGRAAYFQSNNAGATNSAVRVDTNASNPGVSAISGVNTGAGYGGYFEIINAASTSPALLCTTNGTGPALYAEGDVYAEGILESVSPNLDSALFLGWTVDGNGDEMARIRVGGNGVGAINGLDIQKVADVSLMRILNNGSVGIGTTSPTGKLEVVGGVGQFGMRVTSPDIAVYATHNGTGSAPGVYGVTNSASAGAHGVRGLVSGASPASDAAGVHGVCSSTTAGLGVSGEGFWGVYGISKNVNGYGGVFACSDGLFGTGRALLVGGDAEVSDSLLVGNAFVAAQAKLHVVNGSDTAAGGGGFVVIGDTAGANISMDNNEIMARSDGQVSTLYLNNEGGDVRIGQNGAVASTLYVPVVAITGADVAEKFPISDAREAAEPGTVMEIDPDHEGKLRVSRGAYNRRVAGVVSGAGNLPVGAILGNLPGHEDAPPIALTGRVWVKCDGSSSAVSAGDLLTTSDTPGHAMKVDDHARAPGAIIGKAMSALGHGERGLVLVLVNLQ